MTSLSNSVALLLNTWCQLPHLIWFEFSSLSCCDGFLCQTEKDLVGTVSVLHAEIEAPLNLLCDDRNKLLSRSPSLRCSFAIHCVAFWQVFNAPLAVRAFSLSQSSRAREQGCSALLLVCPPFFVPPLPPNPGTEGYCPRGFPLTYSPSLSTTDWVFF